MEFIQSNKLISLKIDGLHNLSHCSTASLTIEFHLISLFEKLVYFLTCLSEYKGCIKSIPISVHIFRISSKPFLGITTAIPNKIFSFS